jgi:hypothetical protein
MRLLDVASKDCHCYEMDWQVNLPTRKWISGRLRSIQHASLSEVVQLISAFLFWSSGLVLTLLLTFIYMDQLD